MAAILFLIGRPGSGKSCAARYIESFLSDREGSSFRINDYTLLQEKQNNEPGRFHHFDKGFEILDLNVLDEVLEDVNALALEHFENKRLDLLMIEFARPSYALALQKFNRDLLQVAYFLFLDAELDTCFERIKIRSENPQTPDDIFLPLKVLKRFYGEDNRLYISHDLAKDFGLYGWQIRSIDNMGTIRSLEEKVVDFIKFIFDRELGKLPETDAIQIVLKPKVIGGEIAK